MRVAWGVLLLSGCATTSTTETFTTQRMAYSTLPVAPLAVSGSPGVSLTARILAGEPQAQAQGGAVGFPSVQPELGALMQIGERTWVGGRASLVTGAFGVRQPTSAANIPSTATAFDVTMAAGHDLRVQQHWGFTISGELGLAGTSLTSSAQLRTVTRQRVSLSANGALGVYATPGPVRLFLAGAASTSTWNDPTSTVTVVCRGVSCSTSDTGVIGITGVGMIGAGARWQASPGFSLALELWVPFTAEAVLLPPMFSVTLRAGDFVVRPRAARPPPLSPPPPPPDVPPEPASYPQL